MGFAKAKKLQKANQRKSLKDLKRKVVYKITKVARFPTSKFGPALTVEIDNENYAYLPKRFATHFNQDDEEFKELENAVKKRTLTMVLDGENNQDVILDDSTYNLRDFDDDDEEM